MNLKMLEELWMNWCGIYRYQSIVPVFSLGLYPALCPLGFQCGLCDLVKKQNVPFVSLLLFGYFSNHLKYLTRHDFLNAVNLIQISGKNTSVQVNAVPVSRPYLPHLSLSFN